MSVEERRAQAEAALEDELRRIIDSGEYARWFQAMARFHRYSPTNTLWILAQRPDATRVASYRTWQQVGRQVRRGETGIMVFHPKPYWVDPATGERVPPPSTERERRSLQRQVSFGVGYVFDIAQTDGEPLPQLGRPTPDEAPHELADHLTSYCRDHGVTVTVEQVRPGLDGYYQRDGDRIVLSAASAPGHQVATLAHELAHREDPELITAHAAGDRGFYAHNRADCEAVAEAVAHTLSARFGHDITAHSAGYIAAWIDGDTERFKQLHQRVGDVAQRLVSPDRLDAILTAARSRATAANQQRQAVTR
jgi:antirestriction protein ArdC